METATRPRPAEAIEAAPPSRVRWLLTAAAGPTLIVVCVLIALRGIAFLPRLSDQHPDLLSFWLPRSCLLGRSLAAGHVPLWNPYEMIGTPFAADPQSGWLSAPTMLLSWAFGCGDGLRALIVLQPIMAGLGLRWFLRREGLGSVAATAGGLSLAMGISASIVAISLPFAGTLAWTPFILVGASGFWSTSGWRRLGWLALAAFAWGQVASAHLSHGLVMASAVTVAYLVARAVREARAGRVAVSNAIWWSVVFLAFLPIANLAIVLPRFSLLLRSSLAGGYGAFEGTLARLSPAPDGAPIATTGIWAAWPVALATTPGGYLGAASLLFVPFALRDRARRSLVVALGVAGLGAYLLTSTLLVGAGWFRSLILSLPFGDVYLHNPARLRYLAFLILPALGAIGLQWLLDERPSFGDAVRWIGACIGILLVLPLAFGARPTRMVVFAAASAAVVALMWATTRRMRWAAVALVGVLAVELTCSAIWSSVYRGGTVYVGLETGDHPTLVAAPLRWPGVDVGDYMSLGPIARRLQGDGPGGGRYLAWIPPDAYFNKGYLFTRRPSDWPALLIGRSVLFRVPDVLGYSPVQLPRYWSYLRGTNRLPVFYNAAVLQVPTLADVRLLAARYLIARQGVRLPANLSGTTVVIEGAYRLLELEGVEPRVSVVPAWRVVEGAGQALDAVLVPGFDPAAVAVLETDPGLEQGPAGSATGTSTGSATYREMSPEEVRIRLHADAPSIVVIRNAWAEGWSATLDGREVAMVPTDLFLQGVAVPAGSHELRLAYREPALWHGLALSALAWLGVLMAVLWALVRDRRRSVATTPSQERDGH